MGTKLLSHFIFLFCFNVLLFCDFVKLMENIPIYLFRRKPDSLEWNVQQVVPVTLPSLMASAFHSVFLSHLLSSAVKLRKKNFHMKQFYHLSWRLYARNRRVQQLRLNYTQIPVSLLLLWEQGCVCVWERDRGRDRVMIKMADKQPFSALIGRAVGTSCEDQTHRGSAAQNREQLMPLEQLCKVPPLLLPDMLNITLSFIIQLKQIIMFLFLLNRFNKDEWWLFVAVSLF